MSSTLLEVTRGAHEEVERLERLIVKDLQREPETNKERMHQNHRVRNMVDAIMSTTQKLVRQQQHPALLLCILSLSFAANGGIRVLNKQIESFDEQIEVYEDSDHSRKDEIAALGGQGVSGQNVFSAFYDRLKEVWLEDIRPNLIFMESWHLFILEVLQET
jgi:splicing factor 3A subunit 3